MLCRIGTSISILIIILNIFLGIPTDYILFAKGFIIITAGYRIYKYIAADHWRWSLPFFFLILYILFSSKIAQMVSGEIMIIILNFASVILLRYSLRHIS